MTSLIPKSGSSQQLASEVGDRAPQFVQVRELGVNGDSSSDEIDLREIWRALQRRRRVVAITAAVVIGLSGVVTIFQRIFLPVYQGQFSLLISDPINSDSNQSRFSGNYSGSAIEELARNTTRSDIPTLIELLLSPLVLSPVAEQLDLSIGEIQNAIEISPGGEKRKQAEGVLNVKVTGGNPDDDQILLELLSKTYLEVALLQRQQKLNDGINFLDKQAPALETKTDQLQQQLADFRKQHNILTPLEEGAVLKQQVTSYTDSVRELEAERSRLISAGKGIRSGTLTARSFQEAIGGDGGGLEISARDTGLLQELTRLDQQVSEARAKFTPESSMLRGLEARRDELIPILRRNQLEAVDAALELNSARLVTAQNQELQLTNLFQNQPQLIKQYENIQRKLTIAQENLSSFLKARETFQLEIAQRTVPWKLISPPQMGSSPVKPSVPRNMALGALLGLVSGAAAGLLRDRFDHVFHSIDDVQEEMRQPLLGHIPHVEAFEGVRHDKRFLLDQLDTINTKQDDDENNQRQRYQRFFYQEAFRNLYTSLRFLNSDRQLRAIALTSSLPAEGKSLVNVLLAKTLSEMGERVLLIDADLRKPQLHHRLGVNNLVGLTNVLTDEDTSWKDAIQNVKGYPTWSLITAGTRPPDPARLLSSKRMKELTKDLQASGEFDLILYDTPPVLGLADAALVAEHVDGLVLLVSLGKVDRNLPKEAVARIQSSGAALLGIATNAISEDVQKSGAYGYGGYGYGRYGYGGRYGYNYGYGAYDVGGAYSYYRQDEDKAPMAPEKRLRRWRNKLVKWIDG